ncbi:MAG: hypothetical protein L6R38_005597 [Xanthoria sp. 2 TBL-2021]|nr:MAG: hypothetical protein L6R38_005597 [Xanthoria sp. 2 TBL-2021]
MDAMPSKPLSLVGSHATSIGSKISTITTRTITGLLLKGSSAILGPSKVKDACEKIQHYGAYNDETGLGWSMRRVQGRDPNLGSLGLLLKGSWRIISAIEQKEESKGSDKHVGTIRDYRQKIETELEKLCQDVLDVLDDSLIPKAESRKCKVFYHKMYVICFEASLTKSPGLTDYCICRKGDYHRYLAKIASGEKRKIAATAAHDAYRSPGPRQSQERLGKEESKDETPSGLSRTLPQGFLRATSGLTRWFCV